MRLLPSSKWSSVAEVRGRQARFASDLWSISMYSFPGPFSPAEPAADVSHGLQPTGYESSGGRGRTIFHATMATATNWSAVLWFHYCTTAYEWVEWYWNWDWDWYMYRRETVSSKSAWWYGFLQDGTVPASNKLFSPPAWISAAVLVIRMTMMM